MLTNITFYTHEFTMTKIHYAETYSNLIEALALRTHFSHGNILWFYHSKQTIKGACYIPYYIYNIFCYKKGL